MTGRASWLVVVLTLALGSCARQSARPVVRIGSLRDVEGTMLGELFAQTIEQTGEARVERRFLARSAAVPGKALEHFLLLVRHPLGHVDVHDSTLDRVDQGGERGNGHQRNGLSRLGQRGD